jgi:hypothetical protein
LAKAGVSGYYARFPSNLATAASTGLETGMSNTVEKSLDELQELLISLHRRTKLFGVRGLLNGTNVLL